MQLNQYIIVCVCGGGGVGGRFVPGPSPPPVLEMVKEAREGDMETR